MQFIQSIPIPFRRQNGETISRMSLPEIIAQNNGTSINGNGSDNINQLVTQLEQLKVQVQQFQNQQLAQQQPQIKLDNSAVEVKPEATQIADDAIDAVGKESSPNGISLDANIQAPPFLPSWRVYWGQKEYNDKEKEELQKKQEEAKKAVEAAEQEKKEAIEEAKEKLEEAEQTAKEAYEKAKQTAEDNYNQVIKQAATKRDNTIQALNNAHNQAIQSLASAKEAYNNALAESDGENTEAVTVTRQAYESALLAEANSQHEYEAGVSAANEEYRSTEEESRETKKEAELNAQDEQDDAIADAKLEAEKTESDAQAKVDAAKEKLNDLNNGKEWGLKIWDPKVVLDGKDIEVENGDILLDVSKDKDSQGTWYIGLFQESDTVVKVIHSSDNLMSSARMLIPLCQVIEDGNAIKQYHVGVVIIGGTIGCFDVSADKKRYLNPYYRVEQYIFQLADTTIPVKKGLHVININNETGGAQIEVLEDGISNLTDDTVDYSSSYIPLYLVEIGKDEDGKECITSMIDFRNIPTAQALLAVAS